jgi:PIN domain nuclease of toxin-antitoxin system
MLNLDTHIVIKAVEGTLTPRELGLLMKDAEWGISAIVLWEIAELHEIGRIRYGLGHAPLAAALDWIHVWPISRQVCLNTTALDFKSDPADELIAATSLTHGIPLVTRDTRIRASRLIQCL